MEATYYGSARNYLYFAHSLVCLHKRVGETLIFFYRLGFISQSQSWSKAVRVHDVGLAENKTATPCIKTRNGINETELKVAIPFVYFADHRMVYKWYENHGGIGEITMKAMLGVGAVLFGAIFLVWITIGLFCH